jgi:hypothetical protein
LHRFRK